MAEGTRLDYSILAAPYSPEKDELIAVLHPVWTTAQLASATSRVNTKDKFLGKAVWDSTKGELVYATGAGVSDPWYTAAELTTPITATSTELGDAGDAINTTNKRTGKMVFNTTTGYPAWAAGGDATDAWLSADITVGVDITPS